jgi:hypothetical protein
MTHCARELYHAQWNILLDDAFVAAYTNGKNSSSTMRRALNISRGFVVCCADGIQRRIYPRIFTYSADYPEK